MSRWNEFKLACRLRCGNALFPGHHDLLYLHSPHFSDDKLQVLVLEMLSLLRYPAKVAEDEAGHSVVIADR